MIWPKPRTSFGPSFSYRLAQAFSKVWKRLGLDFFDRLALPPINHQPSTTSTSILGYLGRYLTRAIHSQATAKRFDVGLGNRARYALRSGATA